MMIFLAAAPVLFKKELESQEATEGDKATLSCETSNPDRKVTWLKGSTVLTHGDKYSIEQRATTHILVIHKLNLKDSGEYTCDTGDKRSTATLTVKGNTASSHLCLLSPLVLISPEVYFTLIHSINKPWIISSAQHLYIFSHFCSICSIWYRVV